MTEKADPSNTQLQQRAALAIAAKAMATMGSRGWDRTNNYAPINGTMQNGVRIITYTFNADAQALLKENPGSLFAGTTDIKNAQDNPMLKKVFRDSFDTLEQKINLRRTDVRYVEAKPGEENKADIRILLGTPKDKNENKNFYGWATPSGPYRIVLIDPTSHYRMTLTSDKNIYPAIVQHELAHAHGLSHPQLTEEEKVSMRRKYPGINDSELEGRHPDYTGEITAMSYFNQSGWKPADFGAFWLLYGSDDEAEEPRKPKGHQLPGSVPTVSKPVPETAKTTPATPKPAPDPKPKEQDYAQIAERLEAALGITKQFGDKAKLKVDEKGIHLDITKAGLETLPAGMRSMVIGQLGSSISKRFTKDSAVLGSIVKSSHSQEKADLHIHFKEGISKKNIEQEIEALISEQQTSAPKTAMAEAINAARGKQYDSYSGSLQVAFSANHTVRTSLNNEPQPHTAVILKGKIEDIKSETLVSVKELFKKHFGLASDVFKSVGVNSDGKKWMEINVDVSKIADYDDKNGEGAFIKKFEAVRKEFEAVHAPKTPEQAPPPRQHTPDPNAKTPPSGTGIPSWAAGGGGGVIAGVLLLLFGASPLWAFIAALIVGGGSYVTNEMLGGEEQINSSASQASASMLNPKKVELIGSCMDRGKDKTGFHVAVEQEGKTFGMLGHVKDGKGYITTVVEDWKTFDIHGRTKTLTHPQEITLRKEKDGSFSFPAVRDSAHLLRMAQILAYAQNPENVVASHKPDTPAAAPRVTVNPGGPKLRVESVADDNPSNGFTASTGPVAPRKEKAPLRQNGSAYGA